MVSALFTTEVTALENQVAQLQARIAEAQQRIAALGEAEFVASGALQAVQEAVAKIAGLAPSAIATLKASVLNLFDGNDGNQGEGGQPVPDGPAPDPLLNGQTCEIDPDAHWVVAKPDGSYWELATPLCCQMEDAPLLGQACEFASCLEDVPTEALQGQAVEIACPVPQAQNTTTNMIHKFVPDTGWGSPASFSVVLKSGQVVEVKFVPGFDTPTAGSRGILLGRTGTA